MKFCIYVSICISLLVYAFYHPLTPSLYELDGEYCIYSREDIKSVLTERKVDYGLGFMYYCKSGNAKGLRDRFEVIDGESIIVQGYLAEEILRKFALQIKSEKDDGIYKTIYAGNKRLGSVQIVVRSADIVIGWPVILGSY